jgi:hypothetical protein
MSSDAAPRRLLAKKAAGLSVHPLVFYRKSLFDVSCFRFASCDRPDSSSAISLAADAGYKGHSTANVLHCGQSDLDAIMIACQLSGNLFNPVALITRQPDNLLWVLPQ